MSNQVHDLDYLLDEVVTLPSLPTAVMRITELLDRPDSSMSDVAAAISVDPALALKTLRLVNSAFHGVRETVTSVDHAVVMLGAKVIRNLVLTASIVDTFENDAGELLRHSICCGVAMRSFVTGGFTGDTPIQNEGDAFVIGLLHDIGKIVFQQYLPKEYVEATKLAHDRGIRLVDAERSVIGSDHAEMGGRLAQHWRLAESLYAPIAGHHDLDQCGDAFKKTAALVAIADYTSYAAGISPANRLSFPMIDESVWDAAGLSGKELNAFLESFFNSAPQIDHLIDVTR